MREVGVGTAHENTRVVDGVSRRSTARRSFRSAAASFRQQGGVVFSRSLFRSPCLAAAFRSGVPSAAPSVMYACLRFVFRHRGSCRRSWPPALDVRRLGVGRGLPRGDRERQGMRGAKNERARGRPLYACRSQGVDLVAAGSSRASIFRTVQASADALTRHARRGHYEPAARPRAPGAAVPMLRAPTSTKWA